MIKITDQMKHLIEIGPDEGVFCMVASISGEGWPHMGPKGSMMAHDEQTLVYWERGLKTTHANITANPHMSVYYHNSKRRDELPPGAGWHFYGLGELHRADAISEEVLGRVRPIELKYDPDRKGAAILIRLHHITDANGDMLQERD